MAKDGSPFSNAAEDGAEGAEGAGDVPLKNSPKEQFRRSKAEIIKTHAILRNDSQ